MNLYEVLNASHQSEQKKKEALKRFGYNYDSMLSNKNNSTYYNPETQKLLFAVKGTDPTSPADIFTDVALLAGFLKNTNRYKDSKHLLKEAKHKYNQDKTTIIGYSLGGAIASGIKSAGDEVYTYNKGVTIGQKLNPHEHAYRSKNDLVSMFNANNEAMHTINNNNNRLRLLKNHELENIKNEDIFI